jgi:hypothetical protein
MEYMVKSAKALARNPTKDVAIRKVTKAPSGWKTTGPRFFDDEACRGDYSDLDEKEKRKLRDAGDGAISDGYDEEMEENQDEYEEDGFIVLEGKEDEEEEQVTSDYEPEEDDLSSSRKRKKLRKKKKRMEELLRELAASGKLQKLVSCTSTSADSQQCNGIDPAPPASDDGCADEEKPGRRPTAKRKIERDYTDSDDSDCPSVPPSTRVHAHTSTKVQHKELDAPAARPTRPTLPPRPPPPSRPALPPRVVHLPARPAIPVRPDPPKIQSHVSADRGGKKTVVVSAGDSAGTAEATKNDRGDVLACVTVCRLHGFHTVMKPVWIPAKMMKGVNPSQTMACNSTTKLPLISFLFGDPKAQQKLTLAGKAPPYPFLDMIANIKVPPFPSLMILYKDLTDHD